MGPKRRGRDSVGKGDREHRVKRRKGSKADASGGAAASPFAVYFKRSIAPRGPPKKCRIANSASAVRRALLHRCAAAPR